MLEEKMTEEDAILRDSGCCFPTSKRYYVIPRVTEDPRVNYGMLRRWIIDFHTENGMKLPKGFYNRNKMQLIGMFNGMLDNQEYDFTIAKILRQKTF